MPKVPLSAKLFERSNSLSVAVGTNCPKGGDSGHGGRTVFRLTNLGGTDMSVRVDADMPVQLGDDRLLAVDSVEIVFGGDSECKTFIEAIEYAVMVLRAQQTQPAAYASTYVEVE